MAGIFYGIGVGPGDPELLTLKAVKRIRRCDVIAAPGEDGRASVAYRIAAGAVPELADKPCLGLVLPMTRDGEKRRESQEKAADQVEAFLKEGKQVGFLNLGDVTVYATALYLTEILKGRGYETELVNGVPSFCAAAARLGEGLAEDGERIHILPGAEALDEALALSGTRVIMKAGKGIGRVKEKLLGRNLKVTMAENCGMPGEKLYRSAEEIPEDAGYYSLLIVKDEKDEGKAVVKEGLEEREVPGAARREERIAPGAQVEGKVPGQEEPGTERKVLWSEGLEEPGGNRIAVVGIGPGDPEQMTLEARNVLEACDLIVGYTVYVDLLRELFPEKEFRTTPMRGETERCRLAFAEAEKGRRVAVVCSGDAGVYGMAGLMLELAPEYPDCSVQVVAGVTAALSGGALLGAPLGHDFAVISLSDLLTPWEKIEARLRAAVQADLAICLYNPSSRKRRDYLRRACDILLETAEKERVCGLARQIGREGEDMEVLTLGELRERDVDMFTTVFIGNSQTRKVEGRMVTPRGYAGL